MSITVPDKLKPLLEPIGSVRLAERNVRSGHSVESIVASLRDFGWHAPLVARKESGEVLVGNGRLKAAMELGLKKVPVVRVNDDDEQAVRRMVADNRTSELSVWDVEALIQYDDFLAPMDESYLLSDVYDSPSSPESGDEGDEAEPQLDRAEELREQWQVEQGQLWLLGEHRVLCGDSTSVEAFRSLLGDEKINVAFTSPPYASQRKYDESSGFKPIHPDEYLNWWEPIQDAVKTHLAADGSFFVNIKPAADRLDTQSYVLELVLAHVKKWGWHWATEFCWERQGMPGKPKRRFKNQFEPVYQFALNEWKFRPKALTKSSGRVPKYDINNPWARGLSGVAGSSGNSWTNISQGLAYPGNRISELGEGSKSGHPASFPIGLPSFFIKAYSDESDVIVDPFLGSGSTLIACEKLGRKCRGIEISPAYVAVTLQRWADHTGRSPVLSS